jgi:hypothetical protein
MSQTNHIEAATTTVPSSDVEAQRMKISIHVELTAKVSITLALRLANTVTARTKFWRRKV